MTAFEIDKLELITNDEEIISLSNEMYNDFYLANIDQNGEEKNYEKGNEGLKANLLKIKIINKNAIQAINYIKNNQNIIKLRIIFKNGYHQNFVLAKKRIAQNGKLINKYENLIQIDEDLGLIITDLDIKFKKELFA